jgi:hypothetical protein
MVQASLQEMSEHDVPAVPLPEDAYVTFDV